MKTAYHPKNQCKLKFIYLQDQKHKPLISQSKNSAVEETAAAVQNDVLRHKLKIGNVAITSNGYCQA